MVHEIHRGGVGHTGVGWVMQRWRGVSHTGVSGSCSKTT